MTNFFFKIKKKKKRRNPGNSRFLRTSELHQNNHKPGKRSPDDSLSEDYL